MAYYVYILASCPRTGAFYVGVTNDLIRRIWQHKEGIAEGFTKKYNIKLLVYYEIHSEIEQAILREKSIKRWTRAKKISAIEEMNPTWNDLYASLM